MAPQVAPAAIISPVAGTGLASDDSVSPPGPDSVHGRQQSFMTALEEAAAEAKQEQGKDTFPYGITVPFKARDVVKGDKCASARLFLLEAPKQALKDMCFYLQMEETGSVDELIVRIVDYFEELHPECTKAKAAAKAPVKATRNLLLEKLNAGPTPARAASTGGAAKVSLTADSSASDLKARLVELGKKDYGSRETLYKRLQEAEAELAGQKDDSRKKRQSTEADAQKPQESQGRLKKMKTTDSLKSANSSKSTENLQDEYCVAGLSIAQQLKMAMQMSMEG